MNTRMHVERTYSPMKLTSAQIDAFVTTGYLLLPALLPAEHVHAAQQLIWTRLRGSPDDPTTWPLDVFVTLDDMTDAFKAWRPPVLDEVAEQLVGTNFVRNDSLTPTINFPRFGHRALSPHGFHIDGIQETTLFPGKRFLVLLAYLNDVSVEGGATVILPRSHRQIFNFYLARGRGPNGSTEIPLELDYDPPIALSGPAGTVIFMHYLLAHGSSDNHSPNIRFLLHGTVKPTEPRHFERQLPNEHPNAPLARTLATA
jgi:hypothetical protein